MENVYPGSATLIKSIDSIDCQAIVKKVQDLEMFTEKQCCGSVNPNYGSGSNLNISTAFKKNLDPDTGSGSGMNNPDDISESLGTVFGLKFGSGMEKIWTRDKYPDPQHW
jgi:hypothetical protein